MKMSLFHNKLINWHLVHIPAWNLVNQSQFSYSHRIWSFLRKKSQYLDWKIKDQTLKSRDHINILTLLSLLYSHQDDLSIFINNFPIIAVMPETSYHLIQTVQSMSSFYNLSNLPQGECFSESLFLGLSCYLYQPRCLKCGQFQQSHNQYKMFNKHKLFLPTVPESKRPR